LRSFSDLTDVNTQARQWLDQIANQRQHRETGQPPDERFQPEALRPLPLLLPDYRDTTDAFVTRIYGCPSMATAIACRRAISDADSLKADASSVTIFDQYHEIVCYARCWQRGQMRRLADTDRALSRQIRLIQCSPDRDRARSTYKRRP
jgi:hypothetical protein